MQDKRLFNNKSGTRVKKRQLKLEMQHKKVLSKISVGITCLLERDIFENYNQDHPCFFLFSERQNHKQKAFPEKSIHARQKTV